MPKPTEHTLGREGSAPVERDRAAFKLLAADEPSPIIESGRQGKSSVVIVVDHAGVRIPRRLGDLGLPPSQLQRHIAWDIGALAVARQVAAELDAPLVAQHYSRLVIDCNRMPGIPSSIPVKGESLDIPGNQGLSDAEVRARRDEIFDPYHNHVSALLDERRAAGRPTILVAQHTMTDVYDGVRREMQAEVLYNRDRRFAGLVLDRLRRETGLHVADNEPYRISDDSDYSIPWHGEARGLPHVAIEIRQDLVSEPGGQAAWARRIAIALRDAERMFFLEYPDGG